MPKFYGPIGYARFEETSPGAWNEIITERNVIGDVIKMNRRLENTNNINDNVNIRNTFSIIADAYAYENFSNMRYIKWMGVLWKITDVEVQRPRLILTVGGLYNGNQTRTT